MRKWKQSARSRRAATESVKEAAANAGQRADLRRIRPQPKAVPLAVHPLSTLLMVGR